MHVHSFLVLVLQGLRKQLYMFLGAGAVNTNQITLSKEKPKTYAILWSRGKGHQNIGWVCRF